MHPDNRHYGHRDALADYAGVPRGRPMVGVLQHGWQLGPGQPPWNYRDPMPLLLWSRRNLDAARAVGLQRAVAIGAPWLYRFGTAAVADAGVGTLAMPFHGWEKQRVQGDFERVADALVALERDGWGPLTVCLHDMEHRDPGLRAVFARRGFEVVTAGPRDDNPAFLDRLQALMRRHRAVTSNRVATATFYALALGRTFVLHGPMVGLNNSEDPDGARFAALQREAFPELVAGPCGGEVGRAIGLRELGAEFLHSPGELRVLLRWSDADASARAWARLRWMAYVARRSARVRWGS